MLVETFAACGADVAVVGVQSAQHQRRGGRCTGAGWHRDLRMAWAECGGISTGASTGRWISRPISRSTTAPDLIFRVHSAFPELADHIVGGSEETTTGYTACAPWLPTGNCCTPFMPSTTRKPSGISIMCTAPAKHAGRDSARLHPFSLPARTLLCRVRTLWTRRGDAGEGLGANVIVTEVRPTVALKATLEGCRVMTMDEAAAVGDVFVTATGMKGRDSRASLCLHEGRRRGVQYRALRCRAQP